MAWTPVIDISQHQGAINFGTMRGKGVRKLIMRISHGATQDLRVRQYYDDALTAGYAPKDIGFYSFINPKRGSGEFTAKVTASMIRGLTGRTNVLYMLDVENYMNESPNIGQSPVRGTAFTMYLREHIEAFKAVMPGSYVMAYSNRAYWNSALGPNDPVLASELEWLVPRYPIYSATGYSIKGYPPSPSQWDEYAFSLATGPIYPIGATRWHGWQFSAGYNKQGPIYGCASSDLDLNIVDSDYADQWFAEHGLPTPPTPIPVPPIQVKEPDVLIPHDGSRLHNAKVLADTPTVVTVAPNTPAEATGVAINITFNGSLRPGFATLWSGEGEVPNVSQINWMATAIPSNGFTIVPTPETYSVPSDSRLA